MSCLKDDAPTRLQESVTDALDLDNAAVCQNFKNDDLTPEGGYGWVCVACVALVNGHTWGINSVCFQEML